MRAVVSEHGGVTGERAARVEGAGVWFHCRDAKGRGELRDARCSLFGCSIVSDAYHM